MITAVIDHTITVRTAGSSPVTQVAVTVAASVVTVVALAIFRWVRRAAHRLIDVAETISRFGKQWEEAASALDYLHEWRHEDRNHWAQLGLLTSTLSRVTQTLSSLARRLDSHVVALTDAMPDHPTQEDP